MLDDQNILSITQITRKIKGTLESQFASIWVRGEISNFKNHVSGHFYFTLKDEGAQLSAVMWRSRVNQLLFRPADGMKVTVRGNITVYEPRGNYQIDCLQIIPAGIGELQIAFERLKGKLEAEGLFDISRKRPLPQFPQKIGIVTSKDGAAIRDILSILRRRFPSIEIIFVPVKVQGIGAAEEIAEGIKTLNRYLHIDVMIVGRGGGSLEDLWAFNEEVVARAIFASKIPVVSAVGHEVDYCISDFVADLRAPTPSAAAELVVPDKREIQANIQRMSVRLSQMMNDEISSRRLQLRLLIVSRGFHSTIDLLHQRSQRIDELSVRLSQRMNFIFRIQKDSVISLQKRVEALNPRSVLKRGYAIVKKNNSIIPSAQLLHKGDSVSVVMHDGVIDSTVDSIQEGAVQ